MPIRRLYLLVPMLAAALAVAACGGPEADPAEPDADTTTAADQADATPQVGLISSGSAEPVPTVAEPERPVQEGMARPVGLMEAAEAVPFTVLAPKTFPSSTHLDLVYLIEAREGETVATLPAVRLIYTIDAGGSVVVYQNAATGQAAEGEPVTIGQHSGSQTSSDPVVFVWEQDGVRIELRGTGIDAAALTAIGASMGIAEAADEQIGSSPVDSAPAPAVTPIPAATQG